MTEERKAPSIRFKEFSGQNAEAWEQRKLGDVSTSFSGGTPAAGNKRYYGGDIPFIRSAEIHSDSTELFLTNEGLENSSAKLVKKGDILYALYGATSGEVDISKINGAINQAILCIVPKINYSSEFIMQWLKHQKKNITDKYLQGGQGNLSGTLVKELDISLPNPPEQKVIGSFFQDLDKLITLQQRKLEKSRRIKKSMLQKMFPEKEQTVPVIRFKEFLDDVWKKRKLEEVAEITMGQSPNSENYTDNPSDYILVQGNADMKDGKVFPRVWTTQVTKQGKEGDLILSVRAPVGDIGKTDYNVVLGRGVAAIRGNEFIFQTLSKMKQNGYWNNLSTGSTFESINSNDIKSATIPLPSPPEQKVIGSFFQDLDKFIALQQRRLDKLQNMKKALLEQMMM